MASEHEPSSYVNMAGVPPLSPEELLRIRSFLSSSSSGSVQDIRSAGSQDSDYTEFHESTHAWAAFADDPQRRATTLDRSVGVMIICFQVFTYWLFVKEALEDYEAGEVAVMTSHGSCLANANVPQAEDMTCEADATNDFDAAVAFFMLGIFLTGDFLQAGRTIRKANTLSGLIFACFVGLEVVTAFLAACVAVSYNLYIGEVTDAVEVGVGLLFIRELSQRAYSGIRQGKVKQYKNFFLVLLALLIIGMISDPLCERLFAKQD